MNSSRQCSSRLSPTTSPSISSAVGHLLTHTKDERAHKSLFSVALCILTLYKPVQFAELHTAGITDPTAAEQAAKLNATSSSAIWNLAMRAAHSLNLAKVPNTFSKIYRPNIAVSPSVLSELRLWAWLVVVDTHWCLLTGHTSSVNAADLLQVTQSLATLKSQVGDVRLAALVELYGIVKNVISEPWYTIIGGTGKRTPAYELRKFNRNVDEWETLWGDKLDEAARAGDTLSATVAFTFSGFVKVIVNSRSAASPRFHAPGMGSITFVLQCLHALAQRSQGIFIPL